jgi:hypothetical protein
MSELGPECVSKLKSANHSGFMGDALVAWFRRGVMLLTVRRGDGVHDGIHRLAIGGQP